MLFDAMKMNDPFTQLNPSDFTLEDACIDIWCFPLSTAFAGAHALLNEEESIRAKRYHFPRHQRRFTLARAILRIILARYLKVSPSSLIFTTNKYGKPLLVNHPSLHFNISHSGELALLAVSNNHPMGIDLEFFSERPYEGIAKSLFSPKEIQAVEQAPSHVKPMIFFQIWSQKEAFIKACGMGLSYPTQQFDVPILHLKNNNQPILDELNQDLWHIKSFMPEIACSGALCYHPSIKQIRYTKLHDLSSLIPLDHKTILDNLSPIGAVDPRAMAASSKNPSVKLHLFESIDSTNRFLKDLAPSNLIDICCTEMQTAGYGRFGRHWYSPYAENIYCSSRWPLGEHKERLAGLSLILSLAMLAALKEFGIHDEIRIKWPNDIYWMNKKLCGTLIEMTQSDIIIGIGLNVNSLASSNAPPNDSWCSLREISGVGIDRNLLIACIINKLDIFLTEFLLQGLSAFFDRWNEVDYLKGKLIQVSSIIGRIEGTAQGIDSKGQLVVVDKERVTHYLSAGDASLHV